MSGQTLQEQYMQDPENNSIPQDCICHILFQQSQENDKKTLLERFSIWQKKPPDPNDIKFLKKELNKASHDAEGLQKTLDELTRSIRVEVLNLSADWRLQLRSYIDDFNDSKHVVHILIRQYRATLEQWRDADQKLGVWESERDALLKDASSKGATIREQHNEIQRLRTRVTALEGDKRSLESDLRQIRQDKRAMENKYETTLGTLRSDHSKEIVRLREEHEQNKRQMDMEYERRKKKMEGEKEQAEKYFTQRLQQEINTRHSEAEEAKRQIESLKSVLLARERFTATTDPELKARFADLAHDVGELSMTDWTFDHPFWTNQLLSRLSRNKRRLKSQILADSIWTTLHSSIFCSPFRAFGEEGKVLEGEWNDSFGADPRFANGDYTWPEPDMEAEKWRYEMVKQLQAILKQPTSESEARIRAKRSFKTNKDGLIRDLVHIVGEVTDVDAGIEQDLQKIVRKAVAMWLEFATQRCRIVVVLPGSYEVSPAEKAKYAQTGSLALTTRPELRRFGTSKGQELHIEDIVKGCEGESAQLTTSS